MPTLAGVSLQTEAFAPVASPANGPLPVQFTIRLEEVPDGAERGTVKVASLNPNTTGTIPLKPEAEGYTTIEVDDTLVGFEPVGEHNGIVWIDIPPGTPEKLTRVRVEFKVEMLINGEPKRVSHSEYSMVSDGTKIWFAKGTPDGVEEMRANLFCRPLADDEPVGNGPWLGHPDADRGIEEGVPVVEPCSPEDS